MRAFFDTNVLVYLFDSDHPDKQARARKLFEQEVRNGSAVLGSQVLQEFYVAATRKLAVPLDPLSAETALMKLAQLPVSQVSTDQVLRAAARCRQEKLSFWDSLIVESALNSGATRLYSEDLQHGRSIEGMSIVNPFHD